MTMGQPYKRAPITEAVIEVRFQTPLPPQDVARVKDVHAKDFPGLNNISETLFAQMENAGAPVIQHHHVGFRMNNADSTDIISITTGAFAYSRLAPYNGWDTFSASALEAYRKLRKAIQYVPLQRLGLRYINRIDIRLPAPGAPLKIEDYLKVEPRFPSEKLSHLQSFVMQTIHQLEEIGCLVTINVASAEAPFAPGIALILDIDIGRNISVPQRVEDIEALLGAMRVEKNQIFELCITDNTRELIN